MALGLTIWGTWQSVRYFKIGHAEPSQDSPESFEMKSQPICRLQPISILKPLKGVDANLEKDLLSFFDLDYPVYELIFSAADGADPAISLVRSLMKRFPLIQARLIVGEINVGPNPKVNNLIGSYREAAHDWILISDSNVRVDRDYLRQVTAPFADDVGIVTAVVSGEVCPSSKSQNLNMGAHLEATFLNTFYARWMLLSKAVGIPVVVGKSMLFRRSQANRFGGLAALGRYLAEDYMAGQAMKLLGYRTEIMRVPIRQPLGEYSLKNFWSRHLRWGRIRKSQAPQAFLFEPFLCLWLSGLIGALALRSCFAVPMMATFIFHVGVWLCCDLLVMFALGSRLSLLTIPVWILRESLHLPMWLHIASGRSVNWRGQKLMLNRGGTITTAPLNLTAEPLVSRSFLGIRWARLTKAS